MAQLRYINVEQLIVEAGGDPWAINDSLQSGRVGQIASLGQAFHNAGQSTHVADVAFDQAKQRFEKAWNRDSGEHPINDSAEVQRVTQTLRLQGSQLSQIGADLETIAATLAEAQRSSSWYISALDHDLEVIDSEVGEALANHQGPDGLCDEAVQVTKIALGQLRQIRDGYSDTLRDGLTHLRTDGGDPAEIKGVDELLIPPSDTKPEDVKRWWDSLSGEQKRLLRDQHPPELGNLDGIPVEVRSGINEAVMHDDINRVMDAVCPYGISAQDLQNPGNDVYKNPAKYGLSATDILRYQNAVKTDEGLKHDAGKNGDYPTYLFAYDPTAFGGKGRTAISIGNPDKAANTSVIVPGTNSSVSGGWLTDGHNDALNLYERANAADPTHPTAVMAWMGYDAPVADMNNWEKAISDPHSLSQVGTPWMAHQGGELLAHDVNGLWVTHDAGTPQHVTVLGHSYGSTTVADAFANSGMHANDAVLLGCPGTDLARNAGDFRLDGGHVYVGDASTDPISWIGETGHLPDWVNDGFGHPVGPLAGLGTDPASDNFGSIRFRAEVPGSDGINPSDHSHYYHQHSESLAAMGDIASGHSERLTTENLIAGHRHQPHMTTPDHVNIPGLGQVHVPHIDVPVPGTATIIDPEWDRPLNSVVDNH
ncbi:putative alpha/beta hydrolase [Mycobacterium noviomagense]|uniref:Alpha/beta hydrolase n=1 Tax=Mycobacterium noviomagense TaxID=459858 RepID=A0A7I7P7K9_9MYCO|nr:alpha/beta hydrolase [Mycobacterium noviomagense]ORB18723.1 hypothetical protein BST37_00735 [Mycobacterium noviomagense]BBY04876.1 hypothetical protein MNVI_01940 [Mycobacterium noviomagense]